MKGSVQKVGLTQLSMVLLMSIGINNYVLVVSLILLSAKRDSWVSALSAGLLAILWLPLLVITMKASQQRHLVDWLNESVGPWISRCITYPFIISQFVMIFITLQDTTRWTNASYLQHTPLIVIAACIIILCFFTVQGGIGPIAVCSGLLFPLAVLFTLFATISNFEFSHFRQLTPMFMEGPKPFLEGILFAGSGLAEIFLILMLQHYVKETVKYRYLFLLLLFILMMTIIPIISALTTFGANEASMQRYPTFEQWKLVRIGEYIDHLDALSIFQWLSGAFIRISLGLLIILDLLKIQKSTHKNYTLLLLCSLLLGLMLIRISDMQLEHWIKSIYIGYFFFIVAWSFFLTILSVIMMLKKKGENAIDS